MTQDEIIAKTVADSAGAWAFLNTSDHWYYLLHTFTDIEVHVRKVGERGAYIVQDENGDFHWTGHRLDSGLREAADYLTQHNRKR